MRLDILKIINFRNYSNFELGNFGDVNLLTGENGSGKTNFLESIQVLLSLHPIRNVTLAELIRWNENSFYISGIINNDKIEIGFSREKKILKWNNNPINAGEYISRYPVVSFLPEDIAVVAGNPDVRRNFFDGILSAVNPDYKTSLQNYQKTLKERNAQIRLNQKEVSIWNHELIHYGSNLMEKRLDFVHYLNTRIKKIYFDFYGQELEIKYLNTFRIENTITESYRMSLEKSSPAELEKGYTLIGPHRDNFEILNLDKKAKIFASQGQRRTIALAFKLCVIELMEKYFHEKPILLLDDVLLELDSSRRNKIFDMILTGYQIFLTSTEANLYDSGSKKGNKLFSLKMYKINNGAVESNS